MDDLNRLLTSIRGIKHDIVESFTHSETHVGRFLSEAFGYSDFMPHGHCYLWRSEILWTHVLSNALISFAYFSIPISILAVVRRRRDSGLTPIYLAFAAFIFSCGFGHLVDIVTIWRPIYYFEGWVKAFTAVMSVATAVLVVKLLPKLVSLPSPASLQDVNESYELILKASNTGIFIWPDTRKDYVRWSPRIYELLGYSKGSLDASFETVVQIVHPEDREPMKRMFDRHLIDGQPLLVEVRIKSKFGQYRWFRVRANSMVSFLGARKMAGSLEDINDIKIAQMGMQEQQRYLEQAIQERTQALDLARVQAEQASVAKTRFLANMSHEIRTPLGIVMGFSRLLADSSQLPEELLSYSQSIRKNGELLLSIINNILDLSKIESGQVQAELEKVSIQSLIEDVRALFGLRCSERGLWFEITKDKNLLQSIGTDPTKFKQILVNLLNNAVKFTAKGGISVHFSASIQKENKSYLNISVRDTGKGIDPSKTTDVFQMFSQEDSSINRQYGGSGLGLHLARKLAQVLGGDVRLVSSVPGKGSEFEVFVENFEIAELAEGKSSKIEKMARVIGSKNLNVLVVDDAVENLQLSGLMLRKMGIGVDLCSDPKKVESIVRQKKFDVILMDIQMPEMDGFQVLTALRKIEGFDTPVWALTAQSFREEVREILEFGFDGYIGKPLDFDLLANRLSQL